LPEVLDIDDAQHTGAALGEQEREPKHLRPSQPEVVGLVIAELRED
jgi:hypothetical protein